MIERRWELDLNQTELGEAVDRSQRLISAIEAGEVNPSLELAMAIAKALNVPAKKLFPDIVGEAEALIESATTKGGAK